jgi:hypothetical protein
MTYLSDNMFSSLSDLTIFINWNAENEVLEMMIHQRIKESYHRSKGTNIFSNN